MTQPRAFKPGDKVRLTPGFIDILKDAGLYTPSVDDVDFYIEKHIHGDVYQFTSRRLMHGRNMRKV